MSGWSEDYDQFERLERDRTREEQEWRDYEISGYDAECEVREELEAIIKQRSFDVKQWVKETQKCLENYNMIVAAHETKPKN